jgi:hypothetical protein
LKFEYLPEFEPEFNNVFGYELGANKGSIHEKNQEPKISCYCTFKGQSKCLNFFWTRKCVLFTSVGAFCPSAGTPSLEPKHEACSHTQILGKAKEEEMAGEREVKETEEGNKGRQRGKENKDGEKKLKRKKGGKEKGERIGKGKWKWEVGRNVIGSREEYRMELLWSKS